ncbi:MAG: RNA polymerase sporulation sigma factor SigH [Ruminococcaceae bacterium]|nr:RNA polymerase sporulation sigma factor SigH [Oscillospiraceae bacterium]
MSTEYSFDNFASFSDEKLAVLAQQGNDRALDYLLDKYRVFVRGKSLSYYIVGADRDDIVQEGMIGLFKAVRDFSLERSVSFKTFADVCVTRQIITAVKNANRRKHAPLNFYVSLNKPVSDGDNDSALGEILGRAEDMNPEEILINREKADSFGSDMNRILSKFELLVLSLYLRGYSYSNIGKAIGKDSKSVDNALQRIKKKFEKISSNSPK